MPPLLHSAWLHVPNRVPASQGDGEDDISRKARRQCEAVRDAVRRGDVAGGLLAADALDPSVLQVQDARETFSKGSITTAFQSQLKRA